MFGSLRSCHWDENHQKLPVPHTWHSVSLFLRGVWCLRPSGRNLWTLPRQIMISNVPQKMGGINFFCCLWRSQKNLVEEVSKKIGEGDVHFFYYYYLFSYFFYVNKISLEGVQKSFFLGGVQFFFAVPFVLGEPMRGCELIMWPQAQWEAWNWSCDLRANERPKKTAPDGTESQRETHTHIWKSQLYDWIGPVTDSVKIYIV